MGKKYREIPGEFLPVMKTALECLDESEEERPEVIWLKDRFDRIRRKYSLGTKMKTDRFVYERMYGHPPRTDTDFLKVRYWRTGKCIPINREQCRLLGNALELSADEMGFLIRGYYDRGGTLYRIEEDSGEYRKKCRRMEKLIGKYLESIPEETLAELKIPPTEKQHYFRHLYFTDAFHYVCEPGGKNTAVLSKHISSAHYDTEIRRQIRLLGEIPRKTMIRHLIILGAPELTLEWMNRNLEEFGYLPLREDHTMTGGERLDRLLIRLFREYEKNCISGEKTENRKRLREICRKLDEFYKEQKCMRMRFMYFKSLEL